jgi:ribosomal subunit interface protein
VDIIFHGRRTSIQERFREYATAKLSKVVKLDQKTISIDVEVTLERNPRQSAQRERVELTLYSRGPVMRAEAAADDRFMALDRALAKLETHMRRACDRRKARNTGHSLTVEMGTVPDLPVAARPAGATSVTQLTAGTWRRMVTGLRRPVSPTGPKPTFSSTGSCRSRWRETARSWCGRNFTPRRR